MSEPATKPVFALVSGAFHLDSSLETLVKSLQAIGYDVRTASLRSAGDATVDMTDDVNGIRDKLLLPLLEAGRDVVLVPHSFSGAAAGCAVKGLSKAEYKLRGLPGGIVGFVGLCAFVLPEGISGSGSMGGGVAPWAELNENTGFVHAKTPKSTFYFDVPEPLATELEGRVVEHGFKAFASAVPDVGIADSHFDGRRAYVRTLHDAALPLQMQDKMLEDSGLAWTRMSVEGGHSPFASRPDEVARLLAELADQFTTQM